MFRYALTFWFAAVLSTIAQPTRQDLGDVLSRAENLYYEAKFNDAIELLTPIDESLKGQPGRVKERVSVKLQLALGHMALNELDKARTHFVEMCTLDLECAIKADQYPPKVRTLFEESKSRPAKLSPTRRTRTAWKPTKRMNWRARSGNFVKRFG